MDWRRPLRAVLASVTGLAFLMLVNVIVWFISLSRRRLANNLHKQHIIDEDCNNIKDKSQLQNSPQTSLKVIRLV